jgi:hypothetical protein
VVGAGFELFASVVVVLAVVMRTLTILINR